MTRTEALLALNDHHGREVEVIVEVETGETPTMVVSAKGVLRHWRDDPRAAEGWWSSSREDITGLYVVGDASIDITELADAKLLVHDDDQTYGVGFDLADGVLLTVSWGIDED